MDEEGEDVEVTALSFLYPTDNTNTTCDHFRYLSLSFESNAAQLSSIKLV